MAFTDDLKLAFRSLAKHRGYALMAAGTLALGVGACTSIFSVFEGVVLAPLPYAGAQQIVSVTTRWQDTGRSTPRVTGGDLVDLNKRSDLFTAISSYYGGEMGVQMQGKADFAGVYFVNDGFFRVFGVQPLAGRLFVPEDAKRAAVVSEGFAQRQFGSADRTIGQTLRVENAAYEIAGVAPDTMRFPDKVDIWLCGPPDPKNVNRTAFNYRVVAKLRPEISVEQAQAGLAALAANLAREFPQSNKNKTFAAVALRDQIAGPVKTTLWWLLASAGLLLLLACANVSNLMLARASARAREIAVCVALGASRAQIVRQTLAESVLLAIAGGALGAVLAYVLTDVLLALAPAGLLRLDHVQVNPMVLGFSLLASLTASVIAGLSPAWQASRVDVHAALKQGYGRGVVGGHHKRLRQGLAVAQVAVAVMLAVGAGLLGRSLAALGEVALGFQPERLLVMYAHAPAGTDAEYVEVTRMFARLLPELGALPGVHGVAAAMGLPAGRYGSNGYYQVDGRQDLKPEAGFRLASAGYFHVMGVPLLSGREFAAADVFESEPVAVISKTLAAQVFPGRDPLNQRLRCGLDRDVWMRVVGVVGDVRPEPGTPAGPELYMPLAQHPAYANEVQVVFRTDGEAAPLVEAIRATVRRGRPDLAMSFTSMDRMLADSTAAPRFRSWLAGSFAALALLLAMAGVYGVISYLVNLRRAEVGLRLALGAMPSEVAWMVLRSAGAVLSAGLALGLSLAVAGGEVMRGFLFDVRAVDGRTYAAVAALMAVAVLLATAGPAWRAARVSPMETLRED